MTISGEFKMKGQYREQYITRRDFSDFQKSSYFSGGILLNTKSYVWHPNLLLVDIGVQYTPESNVDNYIVVPDRSEVRTLKSTNIKTTFLSTSPVTLTTFSNFNESYSNREKLTNLKSNGKRWGGTLMLRSKALPFSINYENSKWHQKEIETGLSYRMEQENINFNIKKSFGTKNKNIFRFSKSNYLRQDYSKLEIKNRINDVNMQNEIYFDSKEKYLFRSNVNNNSQEGNNNFNIFNLTESLTLKLPYNLNFNTAYNLYMLHQEGQELNLNKISANLNHHLFKSLTTSINYSSINTNHTYYQESRNTTGVNITYSKKIPTGLLSLSYQYLYLTNDMNSEPTLLQVVNEEYELSDEDITVIDRSFVDPATVVIKDETGTIIYRPEFDYILIERGGFIEIQRMPGGQIANGATVYVDYIATQSGSYKYDAISKRFNGSISILNGFLRLYSQISTQDYKNIELTDTLVLDYLSQYRYGGNIDIGFAKGGIEIDNYLSTITPYRMKRYYLNIQGKIKDKIILSLNGNIRYYRILDENADRNFSDLSGNITYRFSPSSKIDLNLAYRKQKGEGIDLNLLTGRSEFKTVFRKLFINIGIEVYKRDYLGDKIDFKGAYLQLARKF